MLFRLRYLPPVLGAIGAIAGMAIVSSLTAVKSPALPLSGVPGGISQQKINALRFLATNQACSDQGCTLTVRQSAKAMISFLGVAASSDGLRDFYPINGSGDGVVEPSKVQVFYRYEPDRQSDIAFEIWVPARQLDQ